MTTKKKTKAPARRSAKERIAFDAQFLYEVDSDLKHPGEVRDPNHWEQAIIDYIDQLVELNPSLKRDYNDYPPAL